LEYAATVTSIASAERNMIKEFIQNEVFLWRYAFTWNFWKLFLTGKLG
jgi:hypothetical protein